MSDVELPDPDDLDDEPEAPSGGLVRSFERDPWDRQPGESSKAYHAFSLYRDLGVTRSLTKVAALYGRSVPLMARWSRRWQWVSRAEEYDLLVERRRRAEIEDERAARDRRHRAGAALATTLAMTRMRGRGENEREEGYVAALDPNELDAAGVARLFEMGVKVERLAMGDATDLVRGTVSTVTAAEFQRIAGKLVGAALDLLPEDRRDAYLLRVQAIGQGLD